MSAEVIIPLGHFDHFDPYKMDVQNPATECPDISLLSTSALTVSFEGDTKTPYKELPNTPMQHYLKIAGEAKDFLKSAQSLAKEANEMIDASNISAKETEVKESSIKLVKAKSAAENAARALKEYDEKASEIDEEVSNLQKQIVKERIKGFHAKLQEFDDEITEIQDNETEYERIIQQDESYLDNNVVGKIAYEAGIALLNIYNELNATDKSQMQSQFAAKFKDFKASLEDVAADRFFDPLQKMILGKLLSKAAFNKEDLISEVSKLVETDLQKARADLDKLDAETSINMLLQEKDQFQDRGINNFRSTEIDRLLALQEEIQSAISSEQREKLEYDKNSTQRIAAALEASITLQKTELAELKAAQEQLNSLNLAPALKEIDKILEEDAEVQATEDTSIILAESSRAREVLVMLRSNLSHALQGIELGNDEISVDIALSGDLDRLFILKNNYLKQYILDNKTIENIDKQLQQITMAISNTSLLEKSLLDVEKFIQQTGMHKDAIGIVKEHKEALGVVKQELSERKQRLTSDYERISKELAANSEKLVQLNQNIKSLRDDDSFAPYAAADNLTANYLVHTSILQALQSLISQYKKMLSAKAVQISHEEKLAVFNEEYNGVGEEVEDESGRNNMSLAEELAGIIEDNNFAEAEAEAAAEVNMQEVTTYDDFESNLQMASTPSIVTYKENSKPIIARRISITDKIDANESTDTQEDATKITSILSSNNRNIDRMQSDPANDTSTEVTKLPSIEAKKLVDIIMYRDGMVEHIEDNDVTQNLIQGIKAKEEVEVTKLSSVESSETNSEVSKLNPVAAKMQNISAKMDPMTSLMDFDNIIDIMEGGADANIPAKQVSKEVAASSNPNTKGVRVAASSHNPIPESYNAELLESGALPAAMHNVQFSAPIRESLHGPEGISMHDRGYEKLFAQLNKTGKVTGGSGVSHMQQSSTEAAKMHKNQDVAVKALMAANADSKPLGGGDISLSRYSAEELHKLTGDSYRIGDRLLAALRRMLNPNLVVDITPGY